MSYWFNVYLRYIDIVCLFYLFSHNMGQFLTDIKQHLLALAHRCTASCHFADLKTSTQISIKFTLFTLVQVLLFSILANVLFFQSRYIRAHGDMPQWPRPFTHEKMILGKNRAPEMEVFLVSSTEWQTILASHRWKSIARIDDMYFMYKQAGGMLLVTNVSAHMAVQKTLILISIYLMCFFGALAYLMSRFFVHTSLKKLHTLLAFLDRLDIHHLDQKITISGHPHDEINRVSSKFNDVLEKLNKQTLSLKDFVSNASHELKTPLMSMSTEIDYAYKTQQYQQWLDNIKFQLKGMNTLLETLVTISKLEAIDHIQTQATDISQLTHQVLSDLSTIYHDKHISLISHIQPGVIQYTHKNSWQIIIKNILENAYKFTPHWGLINISLDNKKLIIKDNGQWIAASDLEHIRERFWQADRSHSDTKSFGLWLYLTQLLVQKHKRSITISSKIHKGTTCSITFQK